MPDGYRLFVNDERTVMVTLWEASDSEWPCVEVAVRETPGDTWGPPTYLKEEK